MAVTITNAAARHINQQISHRGKGIGVRLGVKASGCSGMTYVFEFVDLEKDITELDKQFENEEARLFVDAKSLVYIDGGELDYVKEGVNEGFKINNPNATSECGCGESFNV